MARRQRKAAAVPAATLQDGLRRQRAGDAAGAAAIYEAVLAAAPRNSMACNLLGLALCESGQAAAGIARIRRAIALDDRALYRFSLGQALAGAGDLAAAVAAFRHGIALAPQVAASHAALGAALLRLDDLPGAEAALRAAVALDPGDVDAQLGLAAALRRAGRPPEALPPLQAALGLAPRRADAWSAFARALLAAGEPEAAEAAARQAVALAPDEAAAQCDLGDALRARLRPAEAADRYRRAIALRPDFAPAHTHLSNALHDMQDYAAAAAAARAALAVAPDNAAAFCNLGNALQPLLHYDEAEAAYRAAARLEPGSAAHHSNLGVALTAQGRLDEALAAQRRAIALAPGFVDARYNHAVTLLMAGDYAAGWREYEWRWRLPWSPPRACAQPTWQGEGLAGRTILLHAEQGLGDTLQMARYAPLVAARGGRVILEAQAPLLRLLRGMAGVAEVIAPGDAPPPFDLHCPLFSLPRLFGTTLGTVPNAPYLAADPALAAAWPARLPKAAGEHGNGLRVGLVWAGAERIGRHVNRERSIPLARFAALGRIPGVELVSVQKGEAAAELLSAPDGLRMLDPMDDVADFADTAALVAQLDLVISVDTSTAHLAAAMGKPVWLLSRYNGCWRWLHGRADSPWYPSLRLYRQERPGDWGPALGRVRADLAALAGAAGGPRAC